MTHTTTDEQLELLDDIEADAATEGDAAKSDAKFADDYLAREAGFLRQIALEKAVQVARVALAHGRISEAHAADFTVSAAEKFHAYLTQ